MGGGYTGHAIEEPKNPAAHRAWQLLSIFQQAEEGWLLLVSSLAAGYSSAWNRQISVLDDIKAKLQADNDRACFILSILTAGIAGGLIGGIASGAIRNVSTKTFKGAFINGFVTNSASDGASQFGGSAVSYFQSHGSNPFVSPGIQPSTYSATMEKNVRLFFVGLHDHIADIIDDIESGKSPAQDGEQWYQYYRNASFIKSFPSAGDVSRYDFERDASLCLWIAWGAERDFAYWNKAWNFVDNPPSDASGGIYINPLKMEYMKYLSDIPRWDPIIDEIREIDPTLEMRVKRGLEDDLYIPHRPGHVDASRLKAHIDVRTLKTLGIYSRIRSAQTLSGYLMSSLPMKPEHAGNLLMNMTDVPRMN